MSRQRSLQNGKSAFVSESLALRQIGQARFMAARIKTNTKGFVAAAFRPAGFNETKFDREMKRKSYTNIGNGFDAAEAEATRARSALARGAANSTARAIKS